MTFDLVIKNGTIISAEVSYQADIGIRGEQIAAIGQGLSGPTEIEASGKLVTRKAGKAPALQTGNERPES